MQSEAILIECQGKKSCEFGCAHRVEHTHKHTHAHETDKVKLTFPFPFRFGELKFRFIHHSCLY